MTKQKYRFVLTSLFVTKKRNRFLARFTGEVHKPYMDALLFNAQHVLPVFDPHSTLLMYNIDAVLREVSLTTCTYMMDIESTVILMLSRLIHQFASVHFSLPHIAYDNPTPGRDSNMCLVNESPQKEGTQTDIKS